MPKADLVARMAKELKVPVEELYAGNSEKAGESTGIVGLWELMAYHRAVERLHRACGGDAELSEALGTVMEMARKLKEQSHLLLEARAQVNFLEKLRAMAHRD